MTDVKKNREPLFRVVKREDVSSGKAILIRALAVFAALLVNGIFILCITGVDPVSAYLKMLEGAFGNSIYLWATINATMKLLCISVALSLAFKMQFWNCGGEGQVLIGALAAAFVMAKFGESVPGIALFVLMFLAAAVSGAIWGLIPAVFKAQWNTNETLFTLMMNYVAIQLVSYTYNVWRGQASGLGKLNKTTHAGWFPEIMGQRAFLNVIFVLLITVIVYFYLKYSKQGYEISVVGGSQNTARYAGINVKKVIIRTMALSGMLCGICGFLTVAGNDQTISTGTAGGYGFTAIIVAWLSKFNAFYMLGVSLFIVFLEKGTALIANDFSSFSASASAIVTGVILFFVIGSEFFMNYKLVFRKKTAKGGKQEWTA